MRIGNDPHERRQSCPEDCPAYQIAAGCGWLWSNQPCGDPNHRREVRVRERAQQEEQ